MTQCPLQPWQMPSSPRPTYLTPGDYVVTKKLPTRIRCKAYDNPPPYGNLICVMEPETYLGPVERVCHSDEFTTIQVRGYWINVWSARDSGGVLFAYQVPRIVQDSWYEQGWVDDRSLAHAALPTAD